MNTKKDVLEIAKQSITIESKAIANLIIFLNIDLENVIKFTRRLKVKKFDVMAIIESYILENIITRPLVTSVKKNIGVLHKRYLLKEGIL